MAIFTPLIAIKVLVGHNFIIFGTGRKKHQKIRWRGQNCHLTLQNPGTNCNLTIVIWSLLQFDYHGGQKITFFGSDT